MAAARTESPDDLTLVAAVRTGDERAFEVLYGRYRSRITGYVQGMVGDWARAEDVTQEVFISALRRMRATDRPIAFRPWIFEIAKNACIDQFRRSRRAEEVPWETDDGDGVQVVGGGQSGATPRTPESAAESSEQLEHLRGAFGALSESHHEILVLRELEGLSYREIGERMGLSRPGVESTLFRARRRLTEEYDDLSTGRSCERMGTVLAAAEQGLGVREHRRLARHVAWCRPCRRQARIAGVEGLAPAGAAAKIAAFLPLPVVDLLRRLRGGGGGGAGGAAASAAQNIDAMGVGWSKAALAVAALATAGAGAGVVHEVSSAHDGSARTPAHHAAPAATAGGHPVAGARGANGEKVASRDGGGGRDGGRRSGGRGGDGRRGGGRGGGGGGGRGGGSGRGSSSGSAAQNPGRPGASSRPQAGGGSSGSAGGGTASGGPSAPPGTSQGRPTPRLPTVKLPPVKLPPVKLPPVKVPPVKVPPIVVPGLPPVTLPPVTLPPVTVPPITVPPVGLPVRGGL